MEYTLYEMIKKRMESGDTINISMDRREGPDFIIALEYEEGEDTIGRAHLTRHEDFSYVDTLMETGFVLCLSINNSNSKVQVTYDININRYNLIILLGEKRFKVYHSICNTMDQVVKDTSYIYEHYDSIKNIDIDVVEELHNNMDKEKQYLSIDLVIGEVIVKNK